MCVRVCYLRRNLEEFEVDRAQQEPRLVDLHSQGKTARKMIITARKISTNKNLVTSLIILEYYRFTPRG